MNEIVNNQRKIKLDAASFLEFTNRAVAAVEETTGRFASVAFVSDSRMRALNRDFRDKNETTDVLSFPYEPDIFEPGLNFLGDVIISAEQAARQAAENGLTVEEEIRQLILHGILHLCGFDHETDNGEMNQRELKLREHLGI